LPSRPIADYLVGAIDGFSPYFQDRAFPRLARHLAPGGRMYVIGLGGGGNVVLVGDAAHAFPPAGGFEMNTGLQDAHYGGPTWLNACTVYLVWVITILLM
jgi:2-polyprenyl-6-methoxyphenol hydroxylase-like FAD-dependent oxidoreductase